MNTIQYSTISLVSQFEGLSLVPYLDEGKNGGTWTIGYGATKDLAGNPVTANTPPITLNTAEVLLGIQLKQFGDYVNEFIKVPITQNQFDALCSFTYNEGPGALETSTLCKKINTGMPIVENDFTEWDKETINGVLTPSQGLLNRRIKEYQLFIS